MESWLHMIEIWEMVDGLPTSRACLHKFSKPKSLMNYNSYRLKKTKMHFSFPQKEIVFRFNNTSPEQEK